MEERELFEQFIRIETGGQEVRILVRKIGWAGPHTPTSEWVVGSAHPRDSTEAKVLRDAMELLIDPRFFARCAECGSRKPEGWMHEAELCQSCASKNHGVVY